MVHQQQVGDVLHRERGAALSSPGIQGIAPDRLLDGRRATPGGDIEDGRSRVPAQRVKPAAGCDVRGVLLTRIGAIEPVQASIASETAVGGAPYVRVRPEQEHQIAAPGGRREERLLEGRRGKEQEKRAAAELEGQLREKPRVGAGLFREKEIGADSQLLSLEEKRPVVFRAQCPRLSAQSEGEAPRNVVVSLPLQGPDAAGSHGPALPAQIDPEAFQFFPVHFLNDAADHIIIGAPLVFQYPAQERKGLLLRAPAGQQIAQIHQLAETTVRVRDDFTQAPVHDGLHHGPGQRP